MPIDHRILTCTAFIGAPGADGGFELDGSGFFAYLGNENPAVYFLTAQHVLNPDWKDAGAPWPLDGHSFIRINRTRNRPPEMLKTNRADWLYPKERHELDLCAYRIENAVRDFHENLDAGILNAATLSLDYVQSRTPKYTMMLGDSVFIVGAFSGYMGELRNVPIVRQGHIAAIVNGSSDSQREQPSQYLVETRSLGGISGSPIFFDPSSRHGRSGMGWGPARTIDAAGEASPETTIFPYRLIGMILSTWDMRDAYSNADFNTGISVALPIAKIVDFLRSIQAQTDPG